MAKKKKEWTPPQPKYGRATILRSIGHEKNFRIVECRCDCGKVFRVRFNGLQTGNTSSCGCLRIDHALEQVYSRQTHGESRPETPEFRTWTAMKNRCLNPNADDYSKYGGRGITVCKRWRDSYQAFVTDMGRRPGPQYSIDRIDVDGNYEPGNCRWAKQEQQVNNRRNSLKKDGLPLTAWCRLNGMNYQTAYGRYRKGLLNCEKGA